MARIRYEEKELSRPSLYLIQRANEIIASYQAQGYDMTLRQLYYRLVATGVIPNRQAEYNRLGRIIADGRMGGLVDWDAIVDRTRNVRALPHWNDPAAVIATAARQYRNDLWRSQPYRIEGWVEKDALVGVFLPVCQDLDIPLFSCRGYTSISEIWGAAQRLQTHMKAGQDVVILHFGDHDPSGLDMTRDILERLRKILYGDWVRWARDEMGKDGTDVSDRKAISAWIDLEGHQPWDRRLEVRRMALTWEQVQQYSPPPNPAKVTDSRFQGYQAEYGDESWELDALEPPVLDQLVRDGAESVMDRTAYQAAVDRQREGTQQLLRVTEQWSQIEELVGRNGKEGNDE
jgi:hypothetical protein